MTLILHFKVINIPVKVKKVKFTNFSILPPNLIIGVNFCAKFDFLTENDQKRQFKAVLCNLLIFHFFKKIQIADFDPK